MNKIVQYSVFVLFNFGLQAQTWHQIAVPTNEKLNDIEFSSSQVGYIAGNNNTLLKTIDGGRSWNHINQTGLPSSTVVNFTDIEFLNDNSGYLILADGGSRVYQTTDGGITWTELSVGVNQCVPETIHIVGQDHFFMAGTGCFQGPMVAEYISGMWTDKTVPNTFNPSLQNQGMDFSFSANYALLTSHGPHLYRSTDNGQNWDTIPLPLSDSSYLTEVEIINDTLAFAGYNDFGSGFGLFVSHDMGLTWDYEVSMATFYYPSYLSVHKANNGDVYSGGIPTDNFMSGLIFEKIDSTGYWDFEEVQHGIYDFDSYADDITFGVGDSGYLVVNHPLFELGLSNPIGYALKIFPNPSHGTLTVEGLNRPALYEIYDLNGRVLIKGEMNGTSSLDVLELSKGTYLLRLESMNQQVWDLKFIRE